MGEVRQDLAGQQSSGARQRPGLQNPTVLQQDTQERCRTSQQRKEMNTSIPWVHRIIEQQLLTILSLLAAFVSSFSFLFSSLPPPPFSPYRITE